MSFGAKNIIGIGLGLCVLLVVAFLGCEPTQPVQRQAVTIPDGEIDPALWGKAYIPSSAPTKRPRRSPSGPRVCWIGRCGLRTRTVVVFWCRCARGS